MLKSCLCFCLEFSPQELQVTPWLCAVCTIPIFGCMVEDSAGIKWNLPFLSTSWITQERIGSSKRSSMAVWHVNVGVCTSYRVVGHTASSELLLHSPLGTSLSFLLPCPPRSHLLLCSVLRETKKSKGFIGQVSSLNKSFYYHSITEPASLLKK